MVASNRLSAFVVAYVVATFGRLRDGVSHANQWLTGYGEFIISASRCLGEHLSEKYVGDPLRRRGHFRTATRAQGISDHILSLVVVGIVILLGILIYSEINTSLPDPSNADLSTASSNATNTFADSMELAPLVVLVGVAGLILAVVQRFR